MALMNEGDLSVSEITLFPDTSWPTSIPGPQVQFPVLVVHAERTEQQLLPVSGARYDPRPYVAVICLYCGITLDIERSDREAARTIQAKLVSHMCQSRLIERAKPEQYAGIYRALVSSIFDGFSKVRTLSYVCPCDIEFPSTHSSFSAHIAQCHTFVETTLLHHFSTQAIPLID